MDILISSNFERFLYYMAGPEATAEAMRELKEEGVYTVSSEVMERIGKEMMGGWADEAAMASAASSVYEKYDYLMDPHTAVAYAVYNDLRRRGIDRNKYYEKKPFICLGLHGAGLFDECL